MVSGISPDQPIKESWMQITMEELNVIDKLPHYCPVCAYHEWNLDGLVEMIWDYIDVLRIYTKPKVSTRLAQDGEGVLCLKIWHVRGVDCLFAGEQACCLQLLSKVLHAS